MKSVQLFILVMMVATSCSISPREIRYGSDMCQFCKMTVVDSQHGAELVTAKGRIYVFDAIECLINYDEMEPLNEAKYLLVNDYEDPGELIDAQSSYYLISEAIPSPMGAYLTAFSTKQKAENTALVKGGEIYHWSEIQIVINDETYGNN